MYKENEMDNQEQKQVDTRSASQKITDLENAVMSLYHTINTLSKDFVTMKDALKLMDNKTNSIVELLSRGEKVSGETLNAEMIKNNCVDLKARVDAMLASGKLTNQGQIGDDSFVVASEHEDDGTEVNPRVQFAFYVLTPEIKEKIRGAKAGDVLLLQEGKARLKILEVYQIQPDKAPEAVSQIVETQPETSEQPAAPLH